MSKQTVKVPDIGTDEAAEVAEVLVAAGDIIEVEQSIIVLETDKASVEVPSSYAGKVVSLLVKEGDELKTGSPILEVETEAAEAGEPTAAEEPPPAVEVPTAEGDASSGSKEPAPGRAESSAAGKADKADKQPPSAKEAAGQEITIPVPDIGGAENVEVIEISVAVGDQVQEGDSILVLESDKASMEIPSPAAGRIRQLLVKEGDQVQQGQQIAVLHSGAAEGAAQEVPEEKPQAAPAAPEKPGAAPEAPSPAAEAPRAAPAPAPKLELAGEGAAGSVYAGPAVRKLARQLGVDLTKVKPTGPRGRYTKEDVRTYVKEIVTRGGTGAGIPEVPAVDFSKFGEIKRVKMSKIKRSTAANMHRSWLNVPHVTQFDDADITDLEAYRKEQKAEAEKRGSKLTPLPFLLKACALTLQTEPSFNVSLDPDGQHIIEKQYIHIGMAVDAPGGLMVPVIRDVDKKDIWQLAEESIELAGKARDGKLSPRDMQGGCFSISSLGLIGGQGFTPVVNTPEVGILGVSKSSIKPHWDGKQFVPRTFLPLSLSYDHRAVNGADAGRFLTHLVELLGNHRDWIES